jgi:hypothetical protein
MHRKVFVVAISILFAATQCLAASFQRDSKEAIVKQMDKLLGSELKGLLDARNDVKLVAFDRQLLNKFEGDPGGASVYINADPLFVISTYAISAINVKKKSATVAVIFETLAKTKGIGSDKRVFIPFSAKDRVIYNLLFIKGRWLVYDPPPARVSLKVLLDYYDEQVRSFEDIMSNPVISNEQRKQYEMDRKSLNTLKNLRGN